MTDSPPHDDPGSISLAIRALATDDDAAVQKLWDRFFERLCAYARTRVYQRHQHLVDEEDVAASAFYALYDGLRNKRFERVRNRDELWRVLTVLAANKASSLHRHYDTKKRGGGRVMPDSILGATGADGIIDFLQRTVDPAQEAEFENALEELIQQLPGRSFQDLVLMRLGGHSHEEIAKKLDCSVRTVDRKMRTIRDIWNRMDGDPP